MILDSPTERWATDCSVFHGDACPNIHGKPKNATPKMLWRKAKRERPGERMVPKFDRCRELMRDHGMLP